MGKTYRRDQAFRPRKHGRVFTKDPPWKKHGKPKQWEQKPSSEPLPPDDIPPEKY